MDGTETMVEDVRRVWGSSSFPQDDELTVHPLGLDEEFYEGLVGKSWDALDQSFLNYHADCIGLLTPKGFQYFLPAFLIADLKLRPETQIGFWLLGALSGCLGGSSAIKMVSGPEWFKTRMEVLTIDQRKCLARFIRLNDSGPDVPHGPTEYEAVLNCLAELD